MTLFTFLFTVAPAAGFLAMTVRWRREVAAHRYTLARLRRRTLQRDQARQASADWEAEAHDQAAIALSLTDHNRVN